MTEPPTLRWDFGDGLPPVTVEDRVSVGHWFEDQGTYAVKVQVSDSSGLYASAERVVTVTNRKPSRLVRNLGTIVGVTFHDVNDRRHDGPACRAVAPQLVGHQPSRFALLAYW